MYLAIAMTLFALKCQNESKDPTFIPYPATWLNRQSYLNAATTTSRILKECAGSNPDLSLKVRARMACLQHAKQQGAQSALKESWGSSAPSTSEPSLPPSSTD